MAEPGEPGADKHPTGGYNVGMFNEVTSVNDFAAAIGVPKKAIELVVPMNILCKSKECKFKAIEGNYKHCPAHCRSWYPLSTERGYGMIGPQYSRRCNPGHPCDCSQNACEKAGYFHPVISIPHEGHKVTFGHVNLIHPDKEKEVKAGGVPLCLSPWHFYREHLIYDQRKCRWYLDWKRGGEKKYYDEDHQDSYDFPPPRNTVAKWIAEEQGDNYVHPRDRWAQQNTATQMPSWMLDMLVIDGGSSPAPQPGTKRSIIQLQRQADYFKARAMQLQSEKEGREVFHQRQLAGTKRKYEAIQEENEAEIERLKKENLKLQEEKEELEKELARLRDLLEELKQRKASPLCYNDLRKGGILSKHVEAFTLFDTVELNDAFLEIINYAEAFDEGDGMCENLRQYSKVKWDERKGEVEPPCMEEGDEYTKLIKKKKAARLRYERHWKDDYLVFCLYVRCGLTLAAAGSLCGVEVGRTSDIVHEWSQVLDDALQEWFPQPTRRQMLMNYPTRFIEADGHARCYLLLDAFEIFAQSSSNYNVASSTYSDYKGHPTIKWLGATDPIGCPWNMTVPDGNPGRISDVVVTEDTKILQQVPFGHTCKVDKGFIVDNEAALEGVVMDRPQKRLKKQVQQSSADTSQTQKIGNTRIIVENVNGELKLQIRHLNVLIPTLQFGLISKIVRIGYLLQNFKKAIIQNNEPCNTALEDESGDESEVEDEVERPCRAEIRWYGEHGATDAGLRDVRDNVRLWGLKCEIQRHAELSAMEENKGKSAIEISDIVLMENWPRTKRQELYEELKGSTYSGNM
jgi:hypothetical protein